MKPTLQLEDYFSLLDSSTVDPAVKLAIAFVTMYKTRRLMTVAKRLAEQFIKNCGASQIRILYVGPRFFAK